MKDIPAILCKFLMVVCVSFNLSLFAQKPQPTKNLPVIECKSPGNSDFYIIFMTGNGGFRDLAQSVVHYLNSRNISVVSVNTKKYLWSEKTPAQIACDLESLIDSYNIKWKQKKVVIMGYSMGAEILPFAVNCLEDRYRNELKDLILIAPWQKATFEIKIADYFFEMNRGADIYSELIRMKTKRAYVICDDNTYSICNKDNGNNNVFDHDYLGGGHHFGGDYSALSGLIGKRLNLERSF